ncbi:MAG: alpha/beta fold hydrolase [Chitinivibrionales bacterium]|nr:alpha/beta fold hydrolase [Chitinivibrionales bacterium]
MHFPGRIILIPILVIIVIIPFVSLLYIGIDREGNILDPAERARLGGTYIQLSDGIIHYDLTGPDTAQTVVLIHGGTIPLFDFDLQMPALLDEGFRVLRYNQYGRGLSDRPKVEYDRALYGKQLHELLDSLGIHEPVDLLGHSFGALIAVRFTAHNPLRVRKLVLHSPMIDKLSNTTGYTLSRMPVVGRFLTRVLLMPLAIKRAKALLHPLENSDQYLSAFNRQIRYKGFEHSLYSMLTTDAMDDHSEYYAALGEQDREIALVWGTEDNNISRTMVDTIRSLVPQAHYYEIDGAGHSPNLESPEVFNEIIIKFLTRTVSAPPAHQADSTEPGGTDHRLNGV